jgi:hypothetical protein
MSKRHDHEKLHHDTVIGVNSVLEGEPALPRFSPTIPKSKKMAKNIRLNNEKAKTSRFDTSGVRTHAHFCSRDPSGA